MSRTSFFKNPIFGISLCAIALTGCDKAPFENFDFDLRGNRYDTSDAAVQATQNRPKPDKNGVITYPTYQVAVARGGDTIETLAKRVGQTPQDLAKFNGIRTNEPLREGEVLALPSKSYKPNSQPNAGTAATTSQANQGTIDVATLAGQALDAAKPTTPKPTPPKQAQQKSIEPIRHKVTRGETAFIISRLYNVSVRSLAEWNGLDSEYRIREGQVLLIPIAIEGVNKQAKQTIEKPGQGSIAPLPPSSIKPLPAPVPTLPTTVETPQQPKAIPEGGKMAYPVNGSIIREYVKGRNDGIDLSAPEGSTVLAAADGTVATVTADTDQVAIVVIKHPDNLLTVYANIDAISVTKGQTVKRGQSLGKVPAGSPSYMHFEVRKGFESLDPMEFLK